MAMDVKRDPAILKKKKIRQRHSPRPGRRRRRRITVAVSRLQPAAPSVPEGTLWFGTVKRGAMVREVRGAGTLVPEDIRWITATATGRVERIVLRPGAQVKPGTVILELSNPDLKQQVERRRARRGRPRRRSSRNQQVARSPRRGCSSRSTVANAESDVQGRAERPRGQPAARDAGHRRRICRSSRSRPNVDRAKNRSELGKKQLGQRDRDRAVAARAAGSHGQPGPRALRPAPRGSSAT